jgi:4-amino-4-deoxy-L-arabinose transferase-like glycosyltransferase
MLLSTAGNKLNRQTGFLSEFWQLLAIFALSLLLLPRWSLPLLDPEETRYAEIPREMLAQGNWLVPIQDGQAYLDKPPLLYWLVMACYQALGVNILAARLPANLAALGLVALIYLEGRCVAGPRAAFLAAGMLLLMPSFVHYGPMLTMNGLLGFCVLAALLAGLRALQAERFSWSWWILSALATGLGLLAKGPVAVALVSVPLFVYPWLTRGLVRPGWVVIGGYLTAAGLVAAPWYLAIMANNSAFGGYFFLHQHVQRFLTPFDHPEPFWYYLPMILIGVFPWTFLAAGYARERWREWRCCGAVPVGGFFLASALWMICFFSAAGSKRFMYLVPVYPLLALWLGSVVVPWLLHQERGFWWFQGRMWKVVAGLTASAIGIWTWFGSPEYDRHYSLDETVQAVQALGVCQETPIFCFPHSYPGIRFLLGRDDIANFALEQREELLSRIKQQSACLLFVKPALARRMQDNLESSMDCSVVHENARVTAILVRRRDQVQEGIGRRIGPGR